MDKKNIKPNYQSKRSPIDSISS